MTKIKMNLGDVIPYMTQIKKELEEEEHQFYNCSAATAAAGGFPRRRVLEAQRNLEELAMANSMRMEAMNNEKPVKKFTCKTCNRDFSSFQALGGHRAGHKRLPRIVGAGENDVVVHSVFRVSGGFKSRRMHRCSICGVEFAMGQALGGHMRRHRLDDQLAAAGGGGCGGSDCTSETTLDMLRAAADDGGAWENGGGIKGGISDDKGLDLELNPCESGVISANKGLDLDLNLNLYDNYMKFFD